jgi:hypothetical protein
MGALVLTGNTSGSVTVDVPAVAGTNTFTIPAVTGTAITTGDTGSVTKSMVSTSTSTGMGICRAWVNFNGQGTVAIRDSFNVSSITDNGTGNYTVNFTTAMPNANFCAVCAGSDLSAGTVVIPKVYSASSINVLTLANDGTGAGDAIYVNVSIFSS